MRPAFHITADGADVTAAIARRLLRLTVSDEAGTTADTVEIALDDRGQGIALPRKGAVLQVWLGIGAVAPMGRYTVDELVVEGGPDRLVIKAKAADMRQALKAPRSRTWHRATLGQVAAAIAGEHGLTARVAPDLAAVDLGHVDQTEESDLHLLTRLARQYDGTVKPANGQLVLVGRGRGQSASGRQLQPVTLTRSQLAPGWRVTLADRGRYGAVVATWHSPDAAQPQEVRVGTDEPVFRLRTPFPSAEAALAAARAKAADLGRGEGVFSGTTAVGDPMLVAEVPLTLAGLRDGVDGQWTITRAVHRLDGRGGYQTEIEAETRRA